VARVYVSVGSNIDKSNNIRSALTSLRERFSPLTISPVYQSKAVGFDGEDFYNLAVGFDADLSPQTIVTLLHGIEARHGRERHDKRFDSRTLDIDLLLYDDLVLNQGEIELPRAEIAQYAHVLKPLSDIAGERRHPVLGASFEELWQRLARHAPPLSTVEEIF